MKTYTLNTESPEKWGIEAYNGMVIDEDEVKRLAKEWSISIEELLKDLEETEDENSMEKRYFECYGFLDWLKPTDYYAEPWVYVGYAIDDCDEEFDLVRNNKTMEMRYTNI